MKNLVIKVLTVFIVIVLFAASCYAERTRNVVVIPVAAENISFAMREFLTETFIGQLIKSEKYTFLSGKIVKDAINASFKSQPGKGIRCDEAACIREVADNFGTELVLISKIVEEDNSYFVSAKIQNMTSGETVSQVSNICDNCNNKKLSSLLTEVAVALLGETASTASSTTPSLQQSKPQPHEVSRAEPGDSDFSLDDLEKEAERAEAIKTKWNDWLKDMKAGYTKVSSYEKRDVSTDKRITAWERFESSFKEDNPYSQEDETMRSKAKERIAELKEQARKDSERVKAAWASKQSGSAYTDPTMGMEFVFVKGGCYKMGSPSGEKDRVKDEGPVHEVCVDDFYMGKYEVTNEQYRRYRSSHNSKDYKGNSLNGDNQPAVYVSWEEAVKYAEWLSDKTGKRYRLPTEAEWEYAARGGTTTSRYWGDNPDKACKYANVHDRTSKNAFKDFTWENHNCDDGYKVTAPVGRFKPNNFGLHDMLGNVWEWVHDKHDNDAYKQHSRNNPAVEGSGGRRVVRGGSWYNLPMSVRCAERGNYAPFLSDYDLGFRLLRTP